MSYCVSCGRELEDYTCDRCECMLEPAAPAQPAAAPTGEASELTKMSHNLEHVATQWVQLHQELSTALGLDFEPDEDIERYTEAVDELRNQKHNEAFAAGYSAGQQEIARLRGELEASAKAMADAFWHIENVPSESLNHNRVAQGEVDAAYSILDDALKAIKVS